MALLARISSWFTDRPEPPPSSEHAALEALRAAIAPIRGELLGHPIYRVVD